MYDLGQQIGDLELLVVVDLAQRIAPVIYMYIYVYIYIYI